MPAASGPVTLSVLDRLIDHEPKKQVEAPLGRAESTRQLRNSLRRDLEWLLNTRRIAEEATDSGSELYNSLYNYGLPDLSAFFLANIRDQRYLTWLIESCLATFEPRLEGVKVSMDKMDRTTRVIRFQIEGMLRMDPAPERVAFDTVLELTSGYCQVKGDRSV